MSRVRVQAAHNTKAVQRQTVTRPTMSASKTNPGSEGDIPRVGDVPEIQTSAGVSLPEPVRLRAESLFRTDFQEVRIHHGQSAVRAANRLGARAFTVGNNIYFGSGWYQPTADSGLRLLGHELAHVVQQRSGLSESGLRANTDPYEVEAEFAGAAFIHGESVQVRSAGGTHRRPQLSEDPGADAAQTAVADSPQGLPFLGEANTPEELVALMRELTQEVGVEQLALIREDTAIGRADSQLVASVSASPSATENESVQTSSLRRPIQLATVAGCHVPGLAPNLIGIAAHRQIQATCSAIAPGCLGEVGIPGDGRADLVRQRIPALTEIGEIKPASWLGRGLTALAQAQLAGYIAAYLAAYGVPAPIPMWSFAYPGGPFILNPAQTLRTWGPQSGIYYYACTGGRRRRVRVPVRVPRPVPVPVPTPTPAPAPSSGPSAGDVAKGVAVTGAGIGLGYLIYRGVRMIPSLVPPLWPTIPANLAVP